MRAGWERTSTTLILAAICAACGSRSASSSSSSRDDAGSSADAGTVVEAHPSAEGGARGATLFDGGVIFRVWAPNAQTAMVQGDFGSQALLPLGDGTFAGVVPGAHAMQQYSYQLVNGGQTLTRTDPRATLIGNDPGRQEPPGVLFDPASLGTPAAFVPPPLNRAVIYELHLGTFVDPTGMGQGTYASAATKLADLQQLGINMIELMPVAEFPGDFSWGYNPNYPFAPCRAYGPPSELRAFVDQAHQLGMGVILDVVFNHFSIDSSHTPSMSMWCFDGPCAGGGIYFSPEPATPFGPRPAFGVPEVHALILDSLQSWIVNYGVDGFRWDSAVATRTTGLDGTSPELPEGARLLKDMNLAVHALDPQALTIAEDLQGWDPIVAPVNPAAIDTYSSGFGFDSQWDDGFFYTLLPLLTSSDDSMRDMTTLVGPLTWSEAMHRVVYTEDHDKVAPQNGADHQRIPALIGLDQNAYYAKRRSGLGIAVALTAPGVPMLFMGQEFLESLPFPFSPGQALDWSNEQTYAGFRQMVHDLIALRTNVAQTTAGLSGSQIEMIDVTNTHYGNVAPSIVFHRWDQGGAGDDVVVAANFSNTALQFEIGLPRPGTWHVRFNSDDTAYSPDFGGTPSTDIAASPSPLDNQRQRGTVHLGAYSVVILSQ